MHTDSPPPSPAIDRGRSWQALRILAVVLAVEVLLLAWLFGDRLFAIPGKRWATFAALMMLGGMRAHVVEHRDEYRGVRVSWPLVAGQLLMFAGVVGCLAWISAGAARTILGDAGELLAGAVLVVAWFLSSLAVIVPRLDRARRLLETVLVFTAFACAAWGVGDLTKSFWKLTAGTTLQLVELLLTPFAGGPVIQPEHLVIGTADFLVSIGEPCCGFHGIGLITMLLAGYLWWFRRIHRFPQALLLVPIGVVMIWLANAIRITALILVGIWISPDIAVDGFHSAAGWIAFLTVALGLILTAAQMPFFTVPAAAGGPVAMAEPAPDPGGCTAAHPAPPAGLRAPACLVPFLALTAITLLTQAFTSGFDLLYPLRVVVVAAVLWHLRDDFRGLDARPTPLAVAIGAVTFAVWMLLAPAAGPPAADRDPTPLGQPWSTLWLIFRVAGSTLTVPVAEELFFRGFVMRRCIGEDVDTLPVGGFTWFSFLVSSVTFGILHGDAWIAGTVAGMLFAAALYTRRNLGDAIVAHATTNALLSGYVIATGSWSQWG